MRRRHLLMLIALALLWGASFLFIKVAVRELSPATLIVGRLGLAAITLALLLPFTVGMRQTGRQLRANAGWLIAVALINTAIPFWLLSWGETRIDSGLASIIQAAVPIFNAVIAFIAFREVRVTGTRLVGVGVGFVGVALLVGAQPEGKVLGALAVVGMAFCYGLGGLLSGRYLKPAQPIVVAFASTAVAALVWLPVGVAQAPTQMPGWKTIGSVVALGVPGTAIAYLLFFGLITGAGAAYASLVTYLIPPIALAYGAIFLGERFGAAAFGGLALILAGVALGTGGVRLRRQRVASKRDGSNGRALRGAAAHRMWRE
jgi:drug/metabolite transporter (DMT)-like permease